MNIARRALVRKAAVRVVILVALAALAQLTALPAYLERAALDWRYKHHARATPISDQVVFIDIDDESLTALDAEYGAWPWPRTVYKKVVEFVDKGGPKAVIFDILFTESQRERQNDVVFAEVSAAYPFLSHALKFSVMEQVEGQGRRPLDPKTRALALAPIQSDRPSSAFEFGHLGYFAPNPTLLEKTRRLHTVNAVEDDDGRYRRMPLISHYDGAWFPSLALQGALMTLEKPGLRIEGDSLLLLDGERVFRRVPLEPDGTTPVHFYRADQEPPTYRIGALLQVANELDNGTADPDNLDIDPIKAFENKIVIIGASATGLEDLKSTPVREKYPGAYLHASLISNILGDDFLKRAAPLWTFVALALLVGLIYFGVFLVENAALKILLPAVATGAYVLAALFAFQHLSWQWPLGLPVFFAVLALIDAFVHMTFVEGRDRKRMTQTLSKFLSPEVARNLAENGIDPTAEVGSKKKITILFSDIRGFTSMSESMPPENVVRILNEYLGKMTDIVFAHRGTLDKFIGDAVMAFWGAPTENPRRDLDAVTSALEMCAELDRLNAAWKTRGLPELNIGIGVHTGEAIVGNIGSEKRLDYTAIGDNVNLASRLEGLTKLYGVRLILGEETARAVAGEVLCREIDRVVVKGRTEALGIWQPLGRLESLAEGTREKVRRFEEARTLYLTGRFVEAGRRFETLRDGDPVVELYLERCRELGTNPPANWTGVYEATTK